MAPARLHGKMPHSSQHGSFLSTEVLPSHGSSDVISRRMAANCLALLSSVLPVLPFSLGSIKGGGAEAASFRWLLPLPSLRRASSSPNTARTCAETCTGWGTRNGHLYVHPSLHPPPEFAFCKPQPRPPYSGRSRFQLLNLGFKKKREKKSVRLKITWYPRWFFVPDAL